ncbi:MAG: DUF4855 domain-containing protein [Planctomycetes bacterium]|nr:DUF4855 domain-containing protein [Planctomycetota bacterium]
MVRPFNILLLFVLVFSAGPALSQDPDSRAATNSPLWCRHIMLVYVSPSGAHLDFWTRENLKWLAAYCDAKGKPQDLFFDGFQLIGFGCKGGRHLLPLKNRKPAIKSDWEDAIRNFLTVAEKISGAFEDVGDALNRPDAKGKVILAMPYPDTRQKSFGLVNGRTLDLSKNPDRVEAMKWYIDEAVRQWQEREKQGSLKRVKLVAFYWGNEGIGNADVEVFKKTASHVHEKGYLMHWIPCFGCARRDWRELGLDCVTQQINYQNPQKPGRPLTIFDDKTKVVREYGLHGVEMTPMARTTHLNPRIWSWQQVHLANLEAALRLRWDEFPAMTYFHGGDLPKLAADPKTRIFYDKLYKWVKGDLTWEDVEQLSTAVLDDLRAQGHIDEETFNRIAGAKTVLEKLQIMEEPKLEANRKVLETLLAAYTQSSGNHLKDGSFESGMEDWPMISRGVARKEAKARDGRWSLQLALDPSGGTDFVRAYAKSKNIPVQPGQVVRLSAWVNIPRDLQHTNRGLLIGLARFYKGKMVATWTECEVRQTRATDGWKQLTAHLILDNKPCDEVQAIIGMCGAGVAYVDSVELVTLSKP